MIAIMTMNDCYAVGIIRDHIERWKVMELEAADRHDYHSAQSYKDMAYAGKALIIEIERELYN